ncbi:MAG: endopeptidase La [Deltaproteobacteria bacterium]|nr:endopeptidase La [Deltaproteobacteria bacterium]
MAQQPTAAEESRALPVLPLRDMVLFPRMVVPLFVGRPRSIAALERAMSGDHRILLLAQREAAIADPGPDDLHRVGTCCLVKQLLRMPDRNVKVLVEGGQRMRAVDLLASDECLEANAEPLAESGDDAIEVAALVREVHRVFGQYAEHKKRPTPELVNAFKRDEDPGRLVDLLLQHVPLKTADRQIVLELDSPGRRLQKMLELIDVEIEILLTEARIRNRVRENMEHSQRQYFLNEQMAAIQRELGEKDEFKSELDELAEQIKATALSEEARQKAERELRKLKLMSPMSPEATVVRNYLDWMLGIPWGIFTQDKLDLDEAERILDEDHCGLDKIKERIIEHLAVHRLVIDMKGPILCFVGPPGVGKTSLAKSIARATGRNFVRMSLGGVRDEAEIRGHRRTYIGALPGKILQAMKKAGSCNPVLLLDEVDKLSSDFRGDPASALLEVLDPEQNHTFNDHYLDIDYDLSKAMFICTANTLQGIPVPLQDRLEILRLPGYIDEEKLDIARVHLVPKQRKATGLDRLDLKFHSDALKTILRYYTREAGVRQFEREIANCCRKIARRVVKDDLKALRVTPRLVKSMLGVAPFRPGKRESQSEIGVASGLAWTQTGGELLATEVTVMPGKGKLITTGKLGEVMQESVQAAMSYVRSRAASLGLPGDFYASIDVHVHVPEGATPKDGPSAGITIATALVSALTRIPVRNDVALTGEITLRGRVLPIGGLKEKALAAYRTDFATVIMPKDNEKDLAELPRVALRKLRFACVEHMDEVLRHALRLEDPERFFEQLVRHEVANPQPVVTTDPAPTLATSH